MNWLLLGEYCDACRRTVSECERWDLWLGVVELPGGVRLTLCDPCADVHRAVPVVDDTDEAAPPDGEERRARIWREVLRRAGR